MTVKRNSNFLLWCCFPCLASLSVTIEMGGKDWYRLSGMVFDSVVTLGRGGKKPKHPSLLSSADALPLVYPGCFIYIRCYHEILHTHTQGWEECLSWTVASTHWLHNNRWSPSGNEVSPQWSKPLKQRLVVRWCNFLAGRTITLMWGLCWRRRGWGDTPLGGT